MYRATFIRAHGGFGADALAVDDEGGLGGSQDRAGSASGFLMTVFDLSYVGKLDGSGSLLFGTAPTVLDLYEVGTGGDLAVVVRLNLAVTAGASMHHVESGQTASLSCWLAAAAPTAWVSRPHSGLLRLECQAGFRSHLRSCYKHGFELRRRYDGGVDTLLPMRVECLHL